jgi:hypothetical protein
MLLRHTLAPYLHHGMDFGFVVSRQAAQHLWTPLLVENSTYKDIFAVDSYYEGVGNDDVPLKMRSWVHLVAGMKDRYKYYARVDSDSVLQPSALYDKLMSFPRTKFVWCRVGWTEPPQCGGAIIVVTADLIQAIVEEVPVAFPDHDDIALTVWARRVRNQTTNFCFSHPKDIVVIAQGGFTMPAPGTWERAVGIESLVLHGPKQEADFLHVWEVLHPHMLTWRTCVASGYREANCSTMQALSGGARCTKP